MEYKFSLSYEEYIDIKTCLLYCIDGMEQVRSKNPYGDYRSLDHLISTHEDFNTQFAIQYEGE